MVTSVGPLYAFLPCQSTIWHYLCLFSQQLPPFSQQLRPLLSEGLCPPLSQQLCSPFFQQLLCMQAPQNSSRGSSSWSAYWPLQPKCYQHPNWAWQQLLLTPGVQPSALTRLQHLDRSPCQAICYIERVCTIDCDYVWCALRGQCDHLTILDC